jgi:hypothetical protein
MSDIERSDDIGAVCNFLYLSVLGIGNAGKKIYEPSGRIFVRLLKIHHDSAFFTKVIGYFRRRFETFGLAEHYLDLSGRVNVYNFIVTFGSRCASTFVIGISGREGVPGRCSAQKARRPVRKQGLMKQVRLRQ